MPQPVSVISTIAYGAEWLVADASEGGLDACAVLIFSTPPEGIAPQALTGKFIITCSFFPGVYLDRKWP
jgi:hypothetical protein